MRIPLEHPGVGVGIYVRKDDKILLGKRKGFGEGTWCAPGGKLHMYESPEDCAVRETSEEAGIEVKNLRYIGLTNDTYRDAGRHFITLSYVADWKSGEVKIMEPDRCSEWRWFQWHDLPEPLFLSTKNLLRAESIRLKYKSFHYKLHTTIY
jgi:8-oxo-dGTP diphosphatase